MEAETPQEMPEESSEAVINIDVEICNGCPKADVCEVVKSVARLGHIVGQLQNDYAIEVEVDASIKTCGHKPVMEVEEVATL